MTLRPRITDVLSGMLLANSMPHLAVAITGRRLTTPFGGDSSSRINGLWGAINVVAGSLLVIRASGRTESKRDSRVWLVPMLGGSAAWSAFVFVFEWVSRSRQH